MHPITTRSADCKDCYRCLRVCPVKAITGETRKPPYHIHQDICIKCGACIPKCPVDAIYKR